MIKVLLACIAVVTSVVWSVPGRALSINWADAPKVVPSFVLEDRNGAAVALEDFAGRVLVVNLWATWCAPCRLEMPSLAALQAAFPPDEVLVIAVAVDRADLPALDAFMAEVGAENLLVLRDAPAASARALGAPGLPATLVLDRDGAERFRHYGYADWAAADVVAALRDLAAAP